MTHLLVVVKRSQLPCVLTLDVPEHIFPNKHFVLRLETGPEQYQCVVRTPVLEKRVADNNLVTQWVPRFSFRACTRQACAWLADTSTDGSHVFNFDGWSRWLPNTSTVMAASMYKRDDQVVTLGMDDNELVVEIKLHPTQLLAVLPCSQSK
jgi:hypothetical protein